MFEARGCIVALVTPMRADGAIDWECLDALIEWHIEEGVAGLIAVGTTGESATLNIEEHLNVIERAVRCAKRRLAVIAGTGANATDEAMELTRQAARLGADACLLVAPYYNKPTQEGLYRHYHAIAEAVDIPQILYNVPGRTACDILPETVSRLRDIPNIVGVKDATGDLARAAELQKLIGDDFALYSGDDPTAARMMLDHGACGVISVTANIVPGAMARMSAAAIAGDRDRAEALDAELTRLHKAVLMETNPIPVKWALARMERIPDGIRLPLTPLTETFHDEMRDALRGVGALPS